MVDQPNPWAAASWNLTQQAAYIRTYGVALAQARARDAGTTLGAARPTPAPRAQFAGPGTAARPPTYIFNRTIGGAPTSQSRDFPVTYWQAVGVPDDSVGQDGDFAVDLSTSNVYEKASGSWT